MHRQSSWVMASEVAWIDHFPRNWPLARLTIPLGGLSKQVDRLLDGTQDGRQSCRPRGGSISQTPSRASCPEVVYKIGSLPVAAVMPVLNVSSRVTWLELDDEALLESYAVLLQKGILCDVFLQMCSCMAGRSWSKAYGRHYAAWPSIRRSLRLSQEISEQTFRKERRRLQAKHLWMEVKLSWNVLSDGCTVAPTRKSRRCYSIRMPGTAKRIPMKSVPWTCRQRSPGC